MVGMSHHQGLNIKEDYHPPDHNDPAENDDSWEAIFENLLAVLEKLDPSMYVVIRYEDYILGPDKKFELIGDLLGIDPNEFDKTLFSKDEAHMGYFPQ